MRRSFTLPRASVANADGPTLLHEVTGYTESEDAAESILRSIERLGSDTSIRHYEITPTAVRRAYRRDQAVVWSVRAVRT